MVAQEAIDYINSQIQKGVDRESIKTSLLNKGWKGEDIEKAFSYLSPTPQKPPSSGVKTKIVGWLYIILSPFGIFSFLFGVFSFITGSQIDFNMLLLMLAGLASGVFCFVLGSAIKAHKTWSWYAGLGIAGFATLGNLFTLISSFSLGLVIPLLIDAFMIYAFISEKPLFFKTTN